MALALADEGLNPCQIARTTGIPRCTIREWIKYGPPGRRPGRMQRVKVFDPARLPRADYAYMLGMYLGDGYICRAGRTHRLRIAMDSRYPQIIAEVRRALASLLYPNKAAVLRYRTRNMVEIYGYSNLLPGMFPQHGPGPKHRRPIVLAAWQEELVEEHTDLFVRGLIQSDGCRCMNKVWGGKYAYPRYFFTQESVDIMDLFTDACDRLGVDYAFTKRNTVSIAKAASVARLDEFVGPKH